jgi:DNA-binding response OmpR family regulator
MTMEGKPKILKVKVLVLDDADAKVEGADLGAADYFTKPFDIDEPEALKRKNDRIQR